MNILLAQLAQEVTDTFWSTTLRTVDNNGVWIFVGFCVLAGTAKHLVGRILEHNERIAMIRAGMRPEEDDQENNLRRHAG